MLTLEERIAKGADHDERSILLYESISELDFNEGGDLFNFKSGGEGDNGEHLMYLLDCYFANQDLVKPADEESM